MDKKQEAKRTKAGESSFTIVLSALPKMKKQMMILFAVVFMSAMKSMGLNIIIDILTPGLSETVRDKNNIINQIFVRFGWGCTVTITLINASVQFVAGSIQWKRLLGRFVRLLLATVVWWISTSLFEVIESWTMSCSSPNITDMAECQQQEFTWEGFDISGHTFLLMFSILVLCEELSDVSEYTNRDCYFWQVSIISILSFFVFALKVIWGIMLIVTSLFYHVFWHKIVGALFALSGWFLVYSLSERLSLYTGLN
jgi:hypothetical protein